MSSAIWAITTWWARLCLWWKPRVSVANQKVERLEAFALDQEQLDVPITHHFAPQCYMREMHAPKGALIIGHEHKFGHFNIALTGKALVSMDGKVSTVEAPCVIVSEPRVRKAFYILEDMRWATIHPTEETDTEKLEDQLIVKSETWKRHALREAEELRRIACRS